MRDNVLYYGGCILVAIGLFRISGPLAYWWQNPHLTEMQVFQQYWPNLLFAVIFTSVGIFAIDQSKS